MQVAANADTDAAVEVTLDGEELATDPDTVTPDPDSINQAINERINKKLSEEQQKKVAETLDSLSQLRRAVSGTVERITVDSISLSNQYGSVLIALTDDVLIKDGEKKITAEDIAVGDQIVALGAIQSGEVAETGVNAQLDPHLIVVLDQEAEQKPVVLKGTIVSLSSAKLVLLSRLNNEEKTITIAKTTKFEDENGKVAKASDFSEDVAVLVAGSEADGDITAGTIRSLAPLTELKGTDD